MPECRSCRTALDEFNTYKSDRDNSRAICKNCRHKPKAVTVTSPASPTGPGTVTGTRPDDVPVTVPVTVTESRTVTETGGVLISDAEFEELQFVRDTAFWRALIKEGKMNRALRGQVKETPPETEEEDG